MLSNKRIRRQLDLFDFFSDAWGRVRLVGLKVLQVSIFRRA